MAREELPQKMKAYVLEQFNTPYALRELPIPVIKDPNDILVRVEAASYCHTDAVIAAGTVHPPPLPHIGCHEFAGTVVAVSSEMKPNSKIHVGDRIAIPGRGNHVCGKCLECQNPSGPLPDEPGFSVYCPTSGAGLGVDQDGGFREYAIVDSRQVGLIPDGMTAVEIAPLMCAGLTIYSALKKCELRAGQRVGIMGCGGGLGHLGLQFATKMGLKTTGIDVAPRALELAEQLDTGASIINASKESAEDVRNRMGKEDDRQYKSEMGLDAVLILPESQEAFDYGINMVRDGGLVVILSFPAAGFHFAATDIVFRRIRVIGSLIGSNRALADMFDFCVNHGVRAKIKTYSFAEVNELVKDYHSGVVGKLVVDMSIKD